MTTKKLALLLSLTLSACSNLGGKTVFQNSDSATPDERTAEESSLSASLQFKNQFSQQLQRQNNASMAIPPQNAATQTQDLPKHNINYYVRGLMQDLVANLQYVNSTTPVAVVSFVMLDSDYSQANLLGNQIAESLMHEIHKFGIPVIDFKTTDYIRVTETGDFAFTRDYEEVNPSMPARYIVGGTMVKHQGGYLINARIVGIESKAVVASAQSFIPSSVTNALITTAIPNSATNNPMTVDNEYSIDLDDYTDISANGSMDPKTTSKSMSSASSSRKKPNHYVTLTQE